MNQQVKKTRILGLHPWWVLGGILLVAFVVFVIVANQFQYFSTGSSSVSGHRYTYRRQCGLGVLECFC